MLIADVCRLCHLTKKAIEYYEKQGLIKPDILENGYLSYDESTVGRLKEIAVLRHCGLSISHIQTILDAPDKGTALARCRHLAELRIRQAEAQQACINQLMHDYDIGSVYDAMLFDANELYSIHEKLVMAFPGSYGILLSLHFGRFLNIHIETDEQKAAFKNIITYLDQVATQMPEELAEYIEETFKSISLEQLDELATATQTIMNTVTEEPEVYFENHDYNEYLQYRLSDEFRQSQAGRMASLMLEFQNASGYKEVFIANMKRLSPAYCTYLSKLEIANAKLLEKYPQAKQIYPEN